jgi:hypothetical protein
MPTHTSATSAHASTMPTHTSPTSAHASTMPTHTSATSALASAMPTHIPATSFWQILLTPAGNDFCFLVILSELIHLPQHLPHLFSVIFTISLGKGVEVSIKLLLSRPFDSRLQNLLLMLDSGRCVSFIGEHTFASCQ